MKTMIESALGGPCPPPPPERMPKECFVPMTNPVAMNTTPQFIIFGRFKDLANRLRDCGACVQNDWNLVIRTGYATETQLKASVDETCALLDDLAKQVTNLRGRLRHFADTYKAPDVVDP